MWRVAANITNKQSDSRQGVVYQPGLGGRLKSHVRKCHRRPWTWVYSLLQKEAWNSEPWTSAVTRSSSVKPGEGVNLSAWTASWGHTGVKVKLHTFLTSVLDWGEWLPSRPGCLTPYKEPSGWEAHCTHTLSVIAKRKNPDLAENRDRQPVIALAKLSWLIEIEFVKCYLCSVGVQGSRSDWNGRRLRIFIWKRKWL
jgi:hypothetical protein